MTVTLFVQILLSDPEVYHNLSKLIFIFMSILTFIPWMRKIIMYWNFFFFLSMNQLVVGTAWIWMLICIRYLEFGYFTAILAFNGDQYPVIGQFVILFEFEILNSNSASRIWKDAPSAYNTTSFSTISSLSDGIMSAVKFWWNYRYRGFSVYLSVTDTLPICSVTFSVIPFNFILLSVGIWLKNIRSSKIMYVIYKTSWLITNPFHFVLTLNIFRDILLTYCIFTRKLFKGWPTNNKAIVFGTIQTK